MTETTKTAAAPAAAPPAPAMTPDAQPLVPNHAAPSLVIEDPDMPSIEQAVAAGLAKAQEQAKNDLAVAEVEAAEAAKRAAAAPPPEPAKVEEKPTEPVTPAQEPAPEVDLEARARRQRFENAAREERRAREAAAKIKVKEAELAAKEQKIQQWESAMAEAKGNPVKARQIMEEQFGVSYADETSFYVQEGKETPEQKIARLEARLAEVDQYAKKIETDRVAREKAAQEEAQAAIQAQRDQAIMSSINGHIEQNAEKYPLLASGLVENAHAKVLNVIVGVYNEGLNHPGLPQILPGTRLPLDKAAEIAETYFQGRLRNVKLPNAPTTPEAAKPAGASAASPNGAAQRSVKASVTAGLSAPAVQPQAPPVSEDDYETDRDLAIEKIVAKSRR